MKICSWNRLLESVYFVIIKTKYFSCLFIEINEWIIIKIVCAFNKMWRDRIDQLKIEEVIEKRKLDAERFERLGWKLLCLTHEVVCAVVLTFWVWPRNKGVTHKMYGKESKFGCGGKLLCSCLHTCVVVQLNRWQTRWSLLQKLQVVVWVLCYPLLKNSMNSRSRTWRCGRVVEVVHTRPVLTRPLDYGYLMVFRLAV